MVYIALITHVLTNTILFCMHDKLQLLIDENVIYVLYKFLLAKTCREINSTNKWLPV